MNPSQTRILSLALIAIALGTGLAGLLLTRRPPLYAATAVVKVERSQADLPELTGVSGVPDGVADTYFIETEIAMILADGTLNKIITNLDLNQVWGQRFNAGQRFNTPETLELLKTRLTIRPDREPLQIRIAATSESAEEAAHLANAAARAYGDYRADYRRRFTQAALDAYAETYADMEKQITAAREKLAEARQQLDPALWERTTTNPPATDSEVFRQLQSRYSEAALRYRAQSNQFVFFLMKNTGDDAAVEELKAKAGKARAEMNAAETALQSEARQRELLSAYQAARFVVEDLDARFAPLKRKVDELKADQLHQQQPSVTVVESATPPAVSVAVQDTTMARPLLISSVAALILGIGLWMRGGKSGVSTA